MCVWTRQRSWWVYVLESIWAYGRLGRCDAMQEGHTSEARQGGVDVFGTPPPACTPDPSPTPSPPTRQRVHDRPHGRLAGGAADRVDAAVDDVCARGRRRQLGGHGSAGGVVGVHVDGEVREPAGMERGQGQGQQR